MHSVWSYMALSTVFLNVVYPWLGFRVLWVWGCFFVELFFVWLVVFGVVGLFKVDSANLIFLCRPDKYLLSTRCNII